MSELKMVENAIIVIISVLSLSLLLTQITSIELPIIFALKARNTLAAGPPSTQFGTSPELSTSQMSASTNKTCTLILSTVKPVGTPQQTEGPYFVNDIPERSDIRSDPSDGSVQQGILVHLVIHVYSVDHGSCIPLKGSRVDIWHANSQGIYSNVQDLGTARKRFLRGNQVTDGNGTVQFTTIYPGWYQGRTIHIHDKVRTFNGLVKTMEWTSQL